MSAKRTKPSRSSRSKTASNGGRQISRALIILPGPLEKILHGTKTWEIRSRATNVRGPVALIESGSGMVVGTCAVVGCIGPLTRGESQRNARRAGYPRGDWPAAGSFAWILSGARRLRSPVPYRHRRGAIIWVRLTPGVTRRLPNGRVRNGSARP